MNNYRIDLKKNLYTKDSYNRIIDSEFKNLGVKSYQDEIKDIISVEKLFGYYNELFYDIPIDGPINSHEYIAKRSGEYSNFDKNSEIIEALQMEIANLRKENLDKDFKILELETGEKIDTSITSSLNINE